MVKKRVSSKKNKVSTKSSSKNKLGSDEWTGEVNHKVDSHKNLKSGVVDSALDDGSESKGASVSSSGVGTNKSDGVKSAIVDSSNSGENNVSSNEGVSQGDLTKVDAGGMSKPADSDSMKVIDYYDYLADGITINIVIKKVRGEFVPIYDLEISAISPTTEVILEGVRQELIRRVNLGIAEINDYKNANLVEEKFDHMIRILIRKYFPESDDATENFLSTYLKMKSLGLGALELLMADELLEEIVINQGTEPIWVYHKRHGWLKTSVVLKDEEQVKHYASIIGRKVGRQITVLNPLLDAHLNEGDRVNATLYPVSTAGNTITIRKFSKDPWTITKFLKTETISYKAAAIIWTAIQYEMSAIIAGGTASGKTSALNVFAGFFPPNQRIITIEDTREIQLPKFLHWVPLNTILANPEGKGEITMQDLLVNSLRMRPDRILVGEVRRSKETDTLFEAIHTGHSAYATFHANNAKETIERLTNSPLNVPKIMLPAISLIIVQFRNRRSGKRRTFQISEITSSGDANVILQYDAKKDVLVEANKSSAFFENIKLFTGLDEREINADLDEKVKILKYLVNHNINTIDGVGRIMAEYYTDRDNLMKFVNKNEVFKDD
ncbi:MAG: type II/IV secretion system ATPase subunit [Candidatus Woesearchaeota archaeon]